jgi:hypothetical protein
MITDSYDDDEGVTELKDTVLLGADPGLLTITVGEVTGVHV